MDELLSVLEEWVEERSMRHAPAPSLGEALEFALNVADLGEEAQSRVDCLLLRVEEPLPCRCRGGDRPAMGPRETTHGDDW